MKQEWARVQSGYERHYSDNDDDDDDLMVLITDADANLGYIIHAP